MFVGLLLVMTPLVSQAFLPATPLARPSARLSARKGAGALRAVVDPDQVSGFIPHITSNIDSQWLLSTLQGVADAAASTASDVAAAAGDAAATAADAAVKAGAQPNYDGWLGGVTKGIETAITFIHDALAGAGLSNTYGLAIIGFTLLIKLVTLPLNYKQIESTTKMQMIQPKMKELQAKYKSDPQLQQQKLTQLYQENDVNPLAGCLPALVQIPVFISLYRALSNLAALNQLDEPFLWLPSLEGPTYGAAPSEGMSWLTKNWVDGVPSLGWPDTIAFLSVPIILIVSQFISQQILQPQQNKDDPSAQQSQAILKFLPFMVGYFSLNVPSGLGVYWIINNLITTFTTVVVRQVITSQSDGGAAVASAPVIDVTDVSNGKGRKGFSKAPPPPPKKVVEDDEEEEGQPRGKDAAAPAPQRPPAVATLPPDERMGRTDRNSQVEVVKQEGGLTVLREVKNGEVVSTTVRLTPEEMRKRKEALERAQRGEEPLSDDQQGASSQQQEQESSPGMGRKKRSKRRGKK